MNAPTMSEVLRRAVDARLESVNTAIPARVESYDRATQTISAQPLVRAIYFDESGARQSERLPMVTRVPVVFQGAGDYASTFPLAKGDTVLLVFAQASIDKWLARGGDVDPLDDRRFDLSDAIAIPGLRSRPSSLDSSATASDAWVISGPEIRIGGSSGTEPTFKADAFMTALDTLISAIASAVSGIVASSGGSPVGAAAGTAITAAKATFDTAAAAAKTSIARVK